MKIVSNVLENIEGIQVFYIIGLLLFVVLFVAILIRTIRIPRKETEAIKNSILNDDEMENKNRHQLKTNENGNRK